jgi:hypothetical protein
MRQGLGQHYYRCRGGPQHATHSVRVCARARGPPARTGAVAVLSVNAKRPRRAGTRRSQDASSPRERILMMLVQSTARSLAVDSGDTDAQVVLFPRSGEQQQQPPHELLRELRMDRGWSM